MGDGEELVHARVGDALALERGRDEASVDHACGLYPDDPDREKRLRYTQFTRARKSLLIRYEDEPPRLMREYYPEYLSRD